MVILVKKDMAYDFAIFHCHKRKLRNKGWRDPQQGHKLLLVFALFPYMHCLFRKPFIPSNTYRLDTFAFNKSYHKTVNKPTAYTASENDTAKAHFVVFLGFAANSARLYQCCL